MDRYGFSSELTMACWCILIPMFVVIYQPSGAYGRNNSLDDVITFRKPDAELKLATLEAEFIGDIHFQFKTTVTNGVFIHRTGDSLNRNTTLMVELANGDTIRFRYSVCNGLSMLDYKANGSFNDNQWHKVHVQRNHTQTRLRVDNHQYLTEDESTCTLNQTGSLVVGASEKVNGFVGCFRDLRVNSELQNLRGLVERRDYNYGLSVGCIGKCDSSPCFNGGICIEGYSGYTCDCTKTPFAGLTCGKEVGVNMRINYQILLTFNQSQGLPAVDFMNIHVGFTTLRKQGYLMQFRDAQYKDYVSLSINNNGGVKFVADQGFERWEINTPNHGVDYTDGQKHEAKMWREGERGQIVHLQVDNYPIAFANFGISFSKGILDSPKYLFVGNNDTKRYRGFDGCIYRMQIDGIYPLKMAFQDPPSPLVNMTPPGHIREDTCGFEEVTHKPEQTETKPTVGDQLLSTTLPYSNVTIPISTKQIPGAGTEITSTGSPSVVTGNASTRSLGATAVSVPTPTHHTQLGLVALFALIITLGLIALIYIS